jgi:hypothetical protein
MNAMALKLRSRNPLAQNADDLLSAAPAQALATSITTFGAADDEEVRAYVHFATNTMCAAVMYNKCSALFWSGATWVVADFPCAVSLMSLRTLAMPIVLFW